MDDHPRLAHASAPGHGPIQALHWSGRTCCDVGKGTRRGPLRLIRDRITIRAKLVLAQFDLERKKLLPTLYLTENQALVRRDSEDCLLVQIPERRGRDGAASSPARQERIPLVKIDDVAVMGEVTLTASALHLLLERNIEINFLSHYGKFKGRLSPPFSKNALLRLAQYRAHMDMVKRCELARRFVIGKLSNQRQRLQRYNRAQSDSEVSRVIDQLADLIQNLAALPLDVPNITLPLATGDNRVEGTPLETILGIEGAGS